MKGFKFSSVAGALEEARAVLGGRDARMIGYNTLLLREGEHCVVRLYNTNIMRITKDTISLRAGGHMTRLTKERLNEYLPTGFSIQVKKKEWFLWDHKARTEPFFDGILITDNGIQ